MPSMRRHRIGKVVILVLACGAATAAMVLADSAIGDASLGDSLVTRIDQDRYAIGGVRIDKIAREIVAPGWVNLDSGQIEYFATTVGGKTHEAVLVLDAKPLHLQTALLLLGQST